MQQHFQHYKELSDYDVFSLIKQLTEIHDFDEANQIANRLQYRRMPKIVRLDHANLSRFETELEIFKQQEKQYQDWQLLFIHTPLQSYSGEEDPILVVNEAGVIKPISNYSLMLDALSDKLEYVAFLSIDCAIKDDKKVRNFVEYLHKI